MMQETILHRATPLHLFGFLSPGKLHGVSTALRQPLVRTASMHKGTSALQERKTLDNVEAHSMKLKQEDAAKAHCLQVPR